MKRLKAAVFFSGNGTNLKALVEAAEDPEFPAQILLAVTDNPLAPGVSVARSKGIMSVLIPKTGYEEKLLYFLTNYDIICLAGFMRILSKSFLNAWKPRPILNIHPSLLPVYKGLDTHRRALADGVIEHGCTVHHVTEELDAGDIILQEKVPVHSNDTPETLKMRVLEAEHRIYPKALRMISPA